MFGAVYFVFMFVLDVVLVAFGHLLVAIVLFGCLIWVLFVFGFAALLLFVLVYFGLRCFWVGLGLVVAPFAFDACSLCVLVLVVGLLLWFACCFFVLIGWFVISLFWFGGNLFVGLHLLLLLELMF